MEEGTFAGWLKAEGDPVRPGEPLFALETEKATEEVEGLDAGFLRIPPDGPKADSEVENSALEKLFSDLYPAVRPSGVSCTSGYSRCTVEGAAVDTATSQ